MKKQTLLNLFLDPVGDLTGLKIEVDADEQNALALAAVFLRIVLVFDLLQRFARRFVQFELDDDWQTEEA